MSPFSAEQIDGTIINLHVGFHPIFNSFCWQECWSVAQLETELDQGAKSIAIDQSMG